MDSDIRVISGQQKVRSVGSLIATGTRKTWKLGSLFQEVFSLYLSFEGKNVSLGFTSLKLVFVVQGKFWLEQEGG